MSLKRPVALLGALLLSLACQNSRAAKVNKDYKDLLKHGDEVVVVKVFATTCTVKLGDKEIEVTFWTKYLSDCNVPKVEVQRKEPIKIEREDKETLQYEAGQMLLYRAEDRAPIEIKPKKGFSLWKGHEGRTVEQAREFVKDLVKGGNVWETVDDYVKNNNGKFVSGGIDDGFGGFVNKSYYYKIKIKLYEQKLDKASLGLSTDIDLKKEKGTYKIFTDTPDFKKANVIAIKITGAPEVSFATPIIELKYIVAYKKKSDKGWTAMTTRDWDNLK